MPKEFFVNHPLTQLPQPIVHHVFAPSSDDTYSVCIGDLNGDFLGLLTVLLQMGHISCKNKANPEENWSKVKAFASFVRTDSFWAASRAITPKNSLNEAIEYIRVFINTEFEVHPNPKISELIFLGHVLYGSGPSAFVMLAILHFFAKKINYKIILCYHDALAALHKFDISLLRFSQDISSFNDMPCLRLTTDWDETFRSLYKTSILDKTFIFMTKFEEENAFFISNQSCSEQLRTNLMEAFFLEKNISNITNIHTFWKFNFWVFLSENDKHTIESNRFVKSVLDFCKGAKNQSEKSFADTIYAKPAPRMARLLSVIYQDSSHFLGGNSSPVLDEKNHHLFEVLPKASTHFKTTYLFFKETHQSKQISFVYNILSETNDLKLLKIVLRKFFNISYFLDDKHIASVQRSAESLHSSAYDKNALSVVSTIQMLVPVLSEIQKNIFTQNIEFRIAYLRSMCAMRTTKKTTPIMKRLFVETNLFGLCCTLALLWIQNRIIVGLMKRHSQGGSFNLTPIKFEKKDFYFRLVHFNKKNIDFLRRIFFTTQHSMEQYCAELSIETWREIEAFIDTPKGRETAEVLRGDLQNIFDDYGNKELFFVDHLHSVQIIGFMHTSNTHIADAINTIIFKMYHQTINDLFLYFVISDNSRLASSSHAVGMSIECLKSREIKISLYDPNETKGHYKVSFLGLSNAGIKQQVELFFKQPSIKNLWSENSFTSIFCIELTQNTPPRELNISQIGINILSGTITLRSTQCTREYSNQFYFVALHNLILNTTTPDNCFPLESTLQELLEQMVPMNSTVTPRARDSAISEFLNTMGDSKTGNTLLMIAVRIGNLRATTCLLNAGANPNIPNIKDNNNTALTHAIQYYQKNPTNSVRKEILQHIEQQMGQPAITPK